MICNHCGIAFKEQGGFTHQFRNFDFAQRFSVERQDCPQCLRSNIYLHIETESELDGSVDIQCRLIEPLSSKQGSLPTDVPQYFRESFSESSQVLEISPKASAALSRRLLEGILVENGAPAGKNLFQQIEHAVSNGVPSYISDELDYIRQIGKFAAHAKSNRATGEIIDVDKDEAEAILAIIELLFDHYYVMPAKAKRRHQQLEEKLQASKANPVEK